ncbi:MAG: hypothetical protein MUE96_09885 [Bacteroidia bacterium]|jgi:predicted RNase H-like nuclease (RuvC/YqgF family)|nr:hypothetical protein [Bacteroidia bacterium]
MKPIKLLQGSFSKADALDLIEALLRVKIAYHEQKIGSDSNEEDIKMREQRIKQLQDDLQEARKSIAALNQHMVTLSSVIEIG